MTTRLSGLICHKLDTVMVHFSTQIAAATGTILEICLLSLSESVLGSLLHPWLIFFSINLICAQYGAPKGTWWNKKKKFAREHKLFARPCRFIARECKCSLFVTVQRSKVAEQLIRTVSLNFNHSVQKPQEMLQILLYYQYLCGC